MSLQGREKNGYGKYYKLNKQKKQHTHNNGILMTKRHKSQLKDLPMTKAGTMCATT